QVVTVNTAPSAPSAIGGTFTVCSSASTTLTDGTTGGAWSSTNTAAATVTAGGIVWGAGSGITSISYTLSNSCGSAARTQVVTVNTAPSAPSVIGGTFTVCSSASTTLTDGKIGGAWSRTNTETAAVTA